jgi:hypothetical protein
MHLAGFAGPAPQWAFWDRRQLWGDFSSFPENPWSIIAQLHANTGMLSLCKLAPDPDGIFANLDL